MTISIYLDDCLFEILKAKAEKQNRSLSFIVREMINKQIEKESK